LRLHRSASWVTKVERGEHRVDSLSSLTELADVLGVPVGQLTAAAPAAPDREATETDCDQLTLMLDRPASMFARPQTPGRSGQKLAQDAAAMRRDYNHSSRIFMSGVATELPGLIQEAAFLASESPPGQGRAAASATLSNLYRLAALGFRHQGEVPRARLALDRALGAAENADDDILFGAVTATLTNQLMLGGNAGNAVTLAIDAASALDRQAKTSIDAAHVAGTLRLYGAQAAARAGEPADSARLFSMAEAVEVQDAERYSPIFGPANIAVQRAGISIDLKQPAAALNACTKVNPKHLGSTNRECYFYLHKARAHGLLGNLDGALTALTSAWNASPNIVKTDPLGHTQVKDLLTKKRKYDERLHRIARDMRTVI